MTKLIYSLKEATEVLSIGRTKIYEEIAAGKLKAHKIGAKTVITSDSIKEYLLSLEIVAPRNV